MSRGVVGSVPECEHPKCSDEQRNWHRVPGRKAAVGYCRAHHLEWRYIESLRRMRERTAAAVAERGVAKVYAGRPLKPCGTPAAAKRHRQRGEPVCEPCRVADNARTYEWREARRKAREGEALTRAA